MEPFNLEKALAGEPVVTRDGRQVNEIYFFKTDQGDYPLVAIIEGNKNAFTIEGFFGYNKEESKSDLFMKPKVIEGWVNIYEEQGILWTSVAHDSEEEAKEKILSIMSAKYIKTIKITNEV